MLVAHGKLLADPVGFRILDSRFHARLSAAAGNVVLERLAYGLYNMGLDIRRRATEDLALIRRSLDEHSRIVRAIGAGDADGGRDRHGRPPRPHRSEHPRGDRPRPSRGGTGTAPRPALDLPAGCEMIEWSVHFRGSRGRKSNMGEISRRTLVKGAAAVGAASTLGAFEALAADGPPQIGVVGKVKIPWFDNVEKGVLQAGKDLGVEATMINPTTDDPAEQVRAIEDLIAKQVDVIGVVPNDGKALEPVLKRAQDAGIKVVMNE